MAGYAKLFGSILQSTIWDQPADIRCVWITMLALSDRDGVVEAAVPGLAHEARVSRPKCEEALALFMAPDPDSRTPDNDGRRIEKVPGGWRLLNYEMHQERKSAYDTRAQGAARQARYRTRHPDKVTLPVTLRNAPSRSVTLPVTSGSGSGSGSAQADQITESLEPAQRPASKPLALLPLEPAEPAILIFPAVGKGPQGWALRQTQLAEWSRLFPGLDVLQCCREALAWVQADQKRRKTFGGMPRFIVGWLTRNQNRGALGGGNGEQRPDRSPTNRTLDRRP